ncbi:HEPN domain-containing protein [Pseudomonas nunensis]|uniref:HEPN domain-containing protein n=1 Tax=Pseudomonas nunensis TaxID=2961896 RepID=UPI0009E70991|nr:HEPN domain-containing protein [Pseudomonas nunensis]
MPQAKTLFLERMTALRKSVSIDAVTNKDLSQTEHNSIARMLRNGLAVVGFAALEDFIKSRTSEVLNDVGRSGVPFQDLPEKLRNAATIEAVSALSYQLSIRQKADRISYIQEQALKLASTANTAYELTPHAFGYNQANVQDGTILDILKSFKIENPWGQMSQLSSRLSLTALPLNETFKGASLRRHRAAHVAHADTPQTDLSQFVREAFAVAIGFDALISKALSRLKAHDLDYLSGNTTIDSTSIKIRTIKPESGFWKEMVDNRTKAVKVERNLDVLMPLAKSRAAASSNLLVEFNSSGQINYWECH